jgi:PTS system nitrogen regulatory IIA component
MSPEVFDPAAISLHVHATEGRQVLSILAEMSAVRLGLAADEVFSALMAREATGSTGIGRGVAVPHARLPGLTAVRSLVVTTAMPIAFGAIDEQPVDLFFALLAPENAVVEHLRHLAKVARLMRQPSLREGLRRANHEDTVRALLTVDWQANAA